MKNQFIAATISFCLLIGCSDYSYRYSGCAFSHIVAANNHGMISPQRADWLNKQLFKVDEGKMSKDDFNIVAKQYIPDYYNPY